MMKLKCRILSALAMLLVLFCCCTRALAAAHPELLSSLSSAPGAAQVSRNDLLDGIYQFSPVVSDQTVMITSGQWDNIYLSRLSEMRPDLLKKWWPKIDVQNFSNCASKTILPEDKGNLWVMYQNVGQYLGHTISMRITFLDWEYDSNLPSPDYAYVAVTLTSETPTTPNVEIRALKWIDCRYEFLDENNEVLDLKGHFTLSDLDYAQGFQIKTPYDGMYYTAECAARNMYEAATDTVWNKSNNATTPSNPNGWITYTFSGNQIEFRFYHKETYNPAYHTYQQDFPDWGLIYQKQQTVEVDSNYGTAYDNDFWFWRGPDHTPLVYTLDGKSYGFPIEGGTISYSNNGWNPSEFGFTSAIPFGGYGSTANLVVQKTDALTGESLSDAEFTVYEWNGSEYVPYGVMNYRMKDHNYYLENLVRNSSNQGKFKIVETKVPDGYQGPWEQELEITQEGLTTFEYEATNLPKAGKIIIHKSDSVTNQELSGAGFILYAAEDIYSSGGRLLFQKDQIVSEFPLTDEKGMAECSGILPGSYYIEESVVPDGYVRMDQRMSVEIKKIKNLDSDQADLELSIPNQMNSFTLLKKAYNAETQEEGPLSGVEICFWKDGEEETTLSRKRTDEQGKIIWQGLSPGLWHLQETATQPGYLLNDQIYDFSVDENGLVQGQEHAYFELVNQAVSIMISKVDAVTGHSISGAELELYDQNMQLLRKFQSQNKDTIVAGLLPGTYTLREIKAPEGYELAQDVRFIVTENTKEEKITMEDTPDCDLTLQKTIHAREINWEHGDPTFFLRVSGYDLDGKFQSYIRMFHFDQEYVKAHVTEGGDISMSQMITGIPAGTSYKVEELGVLRYEVEAIRGSDNVFLDSNEKSDKPQKERKSGKGQDNLLLIADSESETHEVVVDLTRRRNGSLVEFINQKERFDDFSHNDIKENRFTLGSVKQADAKQDVSSEV